MKHSINSTLVAPSGSITTAKKEYEGDKNIELDIAITGPVTDKEVVVALDISVLKSLFMFIDTNATVKTNSTSSPGATLTLKSNVPMVGNADQTALGIALSVDVTRLYISVAATGSFTFKLRGLEDSTP